MKHVRANDQNQHLISIPKGRVPRTPVMQNPRHWEEGPLGPSFAHPQPHNFPQPNAFGHPPARTARVRKPPGRLRPPGVYGSRGIAHARLERASGGVPQPWTHDAAP
jgi:hypothetical protein